MPDRLPAELERTADLLTRAGAAPDEEPPAALRARMLAAVEAEARASAPAVAPTPAPADARSQRAPARTRWRPRWVFPALAGAVAAVAIALADTAPGGPEGELELDAQLARPGSTERVASAEVRETGIGRVVRFDTRALPILPKGEFYELWFVGPGDRPGRPNRISAGTFHPDPEGRSEVRFAAAVDPARYPVLAVTAEPGDGDPRPSATEVLRSRER